jgi:hypothetical protein
VALPSRQKLKDLFSGNKRIMLRNIRRALIFPQSCGERPELGIAAIAAAPRTALKIENPGQTAGEINRRKGRDARDADIVKFSESSHTQLLGAQKNISAPGIPPSFPR